MLKSLFVVDLKLLNINKVKNMKHFSNNIIVCKLYIKRIV